MSQDSKRRILIIDDEPTHRILAKDYLEEAGYIVRLAEDGKRGLKMASSASPDLILVDLVLPGIDGFEVCKVLRASEITAHIPVVLATASREPDVIARGFEVGVDDFVTKPIDWTFLADRVGHVLAQSAERRRAQADKAAMERQLQIAQESIKSSPSHQGGDSASPRAEAESRRTPVETSDARMTALRQSFETEIQSLEMRNKAQMEAQTAETRSAIAAARETAARELETERQHHASEIERWRAECAATVAAARAAAHAEFEEERLEHVRLMQEARRDVEAAVKSAQESVQAQSDNFSSQHAAQITSIRQEADEQLRVLRESSLAQQRMAEQQHAALLETVRTEGENQLAQLKLSVDAEIQVLAAEYERQLRDAAAEQDRRVQEALGEQELLRQSIEQVSAARNQCSWDIMHASTGSQLEFAKSVSEKIQVFIDAIGRNLPMLGMREALLEAANQCNSLTGSLGCSRMLAQVMSGRTTLNETTFDVARLVRDSVTKLLPIAELNKVSITTDLPDAALDVVADQSRISYGLLSLMMNAIRHSPHGTAVNISVFCNGDDGVEIGVEDKGVGMAQSQLDGLRSCLDRPQPMQADGKLGFGVPLSIALLRLHGGDVLLDSQLGQGTVATLRLPASRRVHDDQGNETRVTAHRYGWDAGARMNISH